ncbi:MAG: 1,4-alpha-glucan branching protein GlgB [Flavobacteriaceae bacterium]|jgi:1,4-alpha-glucan branching enzyme|nr:1,4-alpha-glucan branching protein GlgB [Flavobacteriaceae bacterium]
MSTPPTLSFSLFTDYDIDLFRKGKHYRLYEKMGAHLVEVNGYKGVYFAVWAPNAKQVSVVGDFNNWKGVIHELKYRWDNSGIWEGFIPNIGLGNIYKYEIETHNGDVFLKADPFGNIAEIPPQTASVISTTWYEWKDKVWMDEQHHKNSFHVPMSIYEVHLPSWKKDRNGNVNFRSIAPDLVAYIKETGFTHVEFMPVTSYPYEPSWGYQVTGYYAVDSRLGSPQDLMFLIEELHRNNIGVIMDWVPAHFPSDAHGLYRFDGSFLYEHEDERQGYHPEWNTRIFNYGRNEVKSFLISNAFFWLERFHIDALRVDAVTSMLYLDYARKDGEWVANKDGGNINLEALEFLREFNNAVNKHYPNTKTIAEESTSFPKLTHAVKDDGVGFGMKWMMGWMHDTLRYFKQDFLVRHKSHHDITFSISYAFDEKYVLPLSHDEVVHGKSPMLYKMFGNEWQKHANLRALYLWMYTHPGAKLLFMGDEFAQTSEWDFSASLDWNLLEYEPHQKMKDFVTRLNNVYREEKALYEQSYENVGMEWLHADDSKNSVYVYLRKGKSKENQVLVILNLSSIPYKNFRIALPDMSDWEPLVNSDDKEYWGSGNTIKNFKTKNTPHYGKDYSADIDLPPLCGLIFRRKK